MGVHKRFGLHQVLSYRKELERLRKLDFAAAKRKLEEACECLDRENSTLNSWPRNSAPCRGNWTQWLI